MIQDLGLPRDFPRHAKIGSDEARRGKAFEGLLNGYFRRLRDTSLCTKEAGQGFRRLVKLLLWLSCVQSSLNAFVLCEKLYKHPLPTGT